MEIVAVCGLTYSDFVIERFEEIKRADLLILSFGAVETVVFRNEIKRDDGVFVDLCMLSRDLDCAVLCGADTDVYGIKHKSVIVVDKGRLVDVSDMVNAPRGFDRGTAFKTYPLSAGKAGVAVCGDIMLPECAKTLAAAGAALIVNISDKDIDGKLILAARAAGLYNNLPVLLCARNYFILSDGNGEIKYAEKENINTFSLTL